MKLGDTGLDDLLQEVQYALDDDGRLCARVVRRVVIGASRILQAGCLAIVRLAWRRGALQRKDPPMPAPGEEPFNPPASVLEDAWRQQ